MLKNIKNNRGFTLIELLAVIVILGILMMTAIPAVTKYINNSKKDTFADSAGAYINSARYSLLNDEYSECPLPSDSGQSVCIPVNYIDIDKGSGKSPYGNAYMGSSYVKVEYLSSGKLQYSIDLVDTKGNGTKKLTLESELERKNIATKQSSRTPSSSCTCNVTQSSTSTSPY